METILQLQLIDSSDETICFEDIIPIQYQTPEELFNSAFWQDFRPILQKEVEIVVSPEHITFIKINLKKDGQYYNSIHHFSGINLYNKILEFFGQGARILTSTKRWISEIEITDELGYALSNNETVDEITSSELEEMFDNEYDYEFMKERKNLHYLIERNKAVERKILKVSKEIINLMDEDTFNYILGLTMSEKHNLLGNCLSNDSSLELQSQLESTDF